VNDSCEFPMRLNMAIHPPWDLGFMVSGSGLEVRFRVRGFLIRVEDKYFHLNARPVQGERLVRVPDAAEHGAPDSPGFRVEGSEFVISGSRLEEH